MKKLLLWSSLALGVFILITLFKPQLLLGPGIAIRSGRLTLPGLREEVTVNYDAYAVPHVRAHNEHDLFYAAGYLMASERLFQMDMVNRAAQGRLAELNPGLASADKYLLTWGFYRIAERMVDSMDPGTLEILAWASEGVNAYIESQRDHLPVEFRLGGHQPLAWSPVTIAAYARLMAHELHVAYMSEVVQQLVAGSLDPALAADLFPYDIDESAVAAAQEPLAALQHFFAAGEMAMGALGSTIGTGGSNNWVVSGSRTDSGLPLLANDPHLGFTQPAKWMEMHLTGGRFNVRGVFFPGVPLAVVGHNESIAWGFTNLMTDDADFFVETVDPEDPARYLHKGKSLPFVVREETIRIGDGEPFIVRETVHGVIISDLHPLLKNSSSPVAMRWVGQDMDGILAAFKKFNLARDWDDFSNAVRDFGVPGQSIVYADREGNIGWRPAVHIPIRKDAGKLMLRPGASGEWDWQGTVPFEEMPFIYNPPAGFIATANNKVVDDDYPYYISRYWNDDSRIDRITELLESGDKHTTASMEAIQLDILSPYARQVVPILLDSYPIAGPESEEEAAAYETLSSWDFRMTMDSPAPSIYQAWVQALMEAIYTDELESVGSAVPHAYLSARHMVRRNLLKLLTQGASPWFDDHHTGKIEGRDEIVRIALKRALIRLTDEMGDRMDRWNWGRLHTLTHPHNLSADEKLGGFLNWWLNLNVGPFPSAGSGTTVNAQSYDLNAPFASIEGASFRTVIDLSNLDNSRIVLTTGQSGNPFDGHYRDQAELYNRGAYREVAFTPQAVEQATVSRLVLEP